MRIPAFAVGALAAFAALYACSDYSDADSVVAPNEAGADSATAALVDAAGGTDASTAIVEAAVEAGTTDTCFDFTKGVPLGFVMTGTVAAETTEGLRIALSNGQETKISQTFHSEKPITKSKIDVELSVVGSFAKDQYADIVGLYYGLPATYQKTAQTFLEATATGLDVDVWGAAGSSPFTEHSFSNILLQTSFTHVKLTSSWSPQGNQAVVYGNQAGSFDVKTATTPANDLTIQIGGTVGGPGSVSVSIVLKSLCMALE